MGRNEASSSIDVSFLLIARNEGARLRSTLLAVINQLPASGEIICLNDGSTDGSFAAVHDLGPRVRFLHASGLGVARARNMVALQARGRYLIFLDAHMTLPLGWWEPLVALLDRPGIGAVQPSITGLSLCGVRGYGERFRAADLSLEWLPRRGDGPYPVPILCGCGFAIRRSLFLRIGGMDGGMYGWGAEDCEFSIRLWRLGYQLLVDPRIVIGHMFRKKAPYAIDWPMVLHNQLRVAVAHFSADRLGRVIKELSRRPHFHEARRQVECEDVWAARSWLEQHCVRDDNWFIAMSGKNL